MSRAYATPLEIEINKSHNLTLLMLLITVMAMISIILTPIVIYLKLLTCSFIAYASYVAVLKQNQYRQLIWHEANHWVIKSAAMDVRAQLLPDSYISSWLTILCFRTELDKKVSFMIFSDAVNPEQFRRLRARLKIESVKLFTKKSDPK